MFDKFADYFRSLRSPTKRSREDFFLKLIDKGNVPSHIGIIMDGNGRWAKIRGLPRLAGHRAGAKAIREVVSIAPVVGVKYLTLYTFSIENWKRPKDEVDGLMVLFEEMLEKEITELHQKGVRINVIGHINDLSISLRKCFNDAVNLTKDNDSLVLNIALNYSGRAEIIDAVKKLVDAVEDGVLDKNLITEDVFEKYLYTYNMPDPELIIRTSGELRVSNFLLWQIAYSEFWITRTLWPDFNKEHFLMAIYESQNRKRRYGGLDE